MAPGVSGLLAKAAAVLVAAFALLAPATATAGQDTKKPWAAAEAIRTSLFDARTELLLGGAEAARSAADAHADLSGVLERDLGRFAPAELHDLRGALAAADHAIGATDPVALATAYGTAVAALRRGAYEVTLAYAERDDPESARQWLLIRDFRQATRFTRPGVDATTALDGLGAGELSPTDAVTQIRKDLLDAYQSRLVEYLDEAASESERGYEPAVAESLAIASGYWGMLAPEYQEQLGAAERDEADREFAALPGFAATPKRVPAAVGRAEALLNHFTAAPFTPEEQARRAQQLIRFIDLIPVEYDHGVSGTEVTTPFEITEGIAFVDAGQSALNDLSPELEKLDPQGLTDLESVLDELSGYLDDANEGGTVVPLETIEDAHDRATGLIDESFPAEWKESSDEADYDLVQISLDQMEAAVSAGQPQTAEQARLTAYAFFEFGPEIKLKAFDPGLSTEIEGLMWYGARGFDGLASQIADGAGARDIRTTRIELDDALEDAQAKTGEGESATTVITNSALIVFREGLEAILIIAAITASMIGTKRELRRPILRGALLAVPASIALFFAAILILDSLSQYGEKLEAVVGLVAIGVLLLVLNWFFHKVYWTEWIKGHRERSKELLAEGVGAAGAAAGTITGLYLLGFTSVFREGFETVLFLQSLQLSSGTGIVLGGVTLGLAATAVVGYATFALERKLPYKRLLIVTGMLIALVLIVLVGNTVRTLQGVGWLPITPIDVDFPLWMGTWLGIFPTVESLVSQAVAFAFVVGSYFAAEWVRKRSVRKATAEWIRRREEQSAVATEAAGEPVPVTSGAGRT
ncbi:MAG TPA: FTR1 family protein [Solirubrobacterales bacterium]|jgi:high-affinity iron transporter|nr:FTR1 family protein [Solirubrobacterales bacterium]